MGRFRLMFAALASGRRSAHREEPSYGIVGMLHILPPALAWLWRLVAPRGHDNPSIIDSKGLQSEGVGSYWPFATGRRVTHANLLLDQIRSVSRHSCMCFSRTNILALGKSALCRNGSAANIWHGGNRTHPAGTNGSITFAASRLCARCRFVSTAIPFRLVCLKSTANPKSVLKALTPALASCSNFSPRRWSPIGSRSRSLGTRALLNAVSKAALSKISNACFRWNNLPITRSSRCGALVHRAPFCFSLEVL